MGMKSNSQHFKETKGANKAKMLKLNIQFFASKFKTPNTPKKINKEKQLVHTNGDKNKSKICI